MGLHVPSAQHVLQTITVEMVGSREVSTMTTTVFMCWIVLCSLEDKTLILQTLSKRQTLSECSNYLIVICDSTFTTR